MARLVRNGETLELALTPLEVLGGLRRGFAVPASAVRSAEVVPRLRRAITGVRMPGTGWPGKIALGTWRRRGAKDFVAAYGKDPGIVVELQGQEFARLLVSSKDEQSLRDLADDLNRHSGTRS